MLTNLGPLVFHKTSLHCKRNSSKFVGKKCQYILDQNLNSWSFCRIKSGLRQKGAFVDFR